jgi:hypothetical protein
MLRLRLAYLALASGLLTIVTGCGSSTLCCREEPMFPRLFRGNRTAATEYGGDCNCQSGAQFPQTFEVPPGQGPFIGPTPGPASGPIPITNLPTNPPIINRIPSAPPTPYSPPGS